MPGNLELTLLSHAGAGAVQPIGAGGTRPFAGIAPHDAGDHRVHGHPLPDFYATDGGPCLDDPRQDLVPQHRREGSERFHGGAGLERQIADIRATDPRLHHFQANPVPGWQGSLGDVTEVHVRRPIGA